MTWGLHLAGKPASSGLYFRSDPTIPKGLPDGRLAARMASPRDKHL